MLDRPGQRPGLLASALLHVLTFAILALQPARDARPTAAPAAEPSPHGTDRRVVFLPPAGQLRFPKTRLPAARPEPAPVSTRTPSAQKERISVGPPSAERRTEPLVLRRDDDLTRSPRGTPVARQSASAGTPALPQAEEIRGRPAEDGPPVSGLELPQGLGHLPRAAEGARASGVGRPGPIASAARDYVERSLREGGAIGLPEGTGRQMGPLFFDPQGADFTAWINHFKNEVYRNWIVPQAAIIGFQGSVDLAFVVARDGTLLALTLVRSSGTASLDRAARNAVQGSRLLPLPPDYGPREITMHVRFIYG